MNWIFDLDDTLLDDKKTKEYYLPKLYETYKSRIKYSFQDFIQIWKRAIPEFYERYTRGELTFEEQRHLRIKKSFGNTSLSYSHISEILEKYDLFFKESWSLFADFHSIENLLRTNKTALVTNGDSIQQNEKIDRLGIRSYFDVIIISGDVGYSKPNKNIFEKVARELDCPIESCFYIGDNFKVDIEGSHNAGMKPIWINRYKQAVEGTFDSHIEISSLKELNGIMKTN